jgi:benzoyl-CoA reductase/2-hydroxyglutaryl-CoA dehydratase subunit BcrC/BadD/HgdB
VILSGIIPNPPEILTLLDGRGVHIGNDDLLGCGRRLIYMPGHLNDPLEAMAEGYFAMPPCSTRDSALSERVDYLRKMINESGAEGVIFSMVKFCEPELFDVPVLAEEMRKAGIATLVLDTELNQGISGQLETRIEAFLEMMG